MLGCFIFLQIFSSRGGLLFRGSKALHVQSSSIVDRGDSGGQLSERINS